MTTITHLAKILVMGVLAFFAIITIILLGLVLSGSLLLYGAAPVMALFLWVMIPMVIAISIIIFVLVYAIVKM
jgi:hypothetical protein